MSFVAIVLRTTKILHLVAVIRCVIKFTLFVVLSVKITIDNRFYFEKIHITHFVEYVEFFLNIKTFSFLDKINVRRKKRLNDEFSDWLNNEKKKKVQGHKGINFQENSWNFEKLI